MPKKSKKLKLAIVSLTCCEGCQVAILDLGAHLIELFKHFEVVEFNLVKDEKNNQQYDVVIVEGSPITKENFAKLKEVRKRSKILVVFGSCAHLGGYQQLKNYGDKDKHISYVYKDIRQINNPEIRPLADFVKVDAVIPGCPIDADEFLRICLDIAAGKKPIIPDRTVCYECQIRGNPCLLQQGKPCFGPAILGGCKAVCPSAGFPCYACRGPVREPNLPRLYKIFQQHGLEKQFKLLMEEFGAEDEINIV